MKYIKSSCPECKGPFEFPDYGVGESVPCPHCQELVTLAPSIREWRTSTKIAVVVLLAAGIVSGTALYIYTDAQNSRRQRDEQSRQLEEQRQEAEADARQRSELARIDAESQAQIERDNIEQHRQDEAARLAKIAEGAEFQREQEAFQHRMDALSQHTDAWLAESHRQQEANQQRWDAQAAESRRRAEEIQRQFNQPQQPVRYIWRYNWSTGNWELTPQYY